MKQYWLRGILKRVAKNVQQLLPGRDQMNEGQRASTPLELDTLKQMVRSVATTRPDEISCGECYEQLDRFAELTLAGKNAAEAMPLVQAHLDRCDDCREEFEALLTALRGVA